MKRVVQGEEGELLVAAEIVIMIFRGIENLKSFSLSVDSQEGSHLVERCIIPMMVKSFIH